MAQYIMALDAGTSSNRCILFNREGEVASMAQKEFRQIYPRPGWVEHDAREIFATQIGVAVEAMNQIGARAEDIAAIGIANQRETVVLWDRETGEPLHNAIVWQCRRTANDCDELRRLGHAKSIQEKTGLIIDPYFSATKLKWLLDQVPGARERAERGELLCGTIDSWLIWKLSRGARHVTDYSNASRTMLFNIQDLSWDSELLDLLDIPLALLPEVRPSSEIYCTTDPSFFGQAIPIAAAAGDQQAALFGQACFAPGEAKNTYGTGCFLLMNTGAERVRSEHGLLTTIAWGLDGHVNYALEGSVFIAGAAIQWLRDELGLIERASDTAEIAASVSDSNGCYLVPAFTGLGAPYWDSAARGTLVGLTRGVTRAHVVRATVEAIAHQAADVLQAMTEDSGIDLQLLRVDGGASQNDFLMAYQADLIGVPVQRPASIETTALGAASLAGLAVGFWSSPAELRAQRETASGSRLFRPQWGESERRKARRGWQRAVERSLDWARES